LNTIWYLPFISATATISNEHISILTGRGDNAKEKSPPLMREDYLLVRLMVVVSPSPSEEILLLNYRYDHRKLIGE